MLNLENIKIEKNIPIPRKGLLDTEKIHNFLDKLELDECIRFDFIKGDLKLKQYLKSNVAYYYQKYDNNKKFSVREGDNKIGIWRIK